MLGGLLVVTAGPAVINPYRLIGLGDWLWLWCVLAVSGFGLLSVAGVRLAIAGRGVRRWLLTSCAGCTALAGLAGIAWGGLTAMLVDYSDEQRVTTVSPDGRFAVILYYADRRSARLTDRPDGLYLQTTEGFFSKRAYLGCLSDSGPHRLDSVWFADANTVVVRQEGEEGMTERSVSFNAWGTVAHPPSTPVDESRLRCPPRILIA